MNPKKVKYLLWSLGLAAVLTIVAAWLATYWFHSRTLVVAALVVVLPCLCVAGVAISLALWRCPHCGGHLGTSVPRFCPHCGKRIDT